jgi:hypothetical protein
MIKANELRIGNRVSVMLKSFLAIDTTDEKEFSVLGFGEGGITIKAWSCGQQEFVTLEYINPIPLTPELLEKIGFKREDDTWTSKEYGVCNWLLLEQQENHYVLLVGEYHEGKPFQHLHQLQNLYFALTGEELVITL